MICPNCNSTDLKRVSLIHAAGSYESRGRIRGLLLGSDVGFLLGKYRGMSQSRLSKALAPPAKAPYTLPVIFWLIGFFTVMAFAGRGRLSWIMGAFSVGYLLLLPVYLLAALLYNFLVRPRNDKDWKEEFLCQRCGARSTIRDHKLEPSLEPAMRETRLSP
jgi:hypothetical protein